MPEREIIRSCILNWNSINTHYTSSAIEPVMWETHSRPELGGGAQQVINRQLVDWCDFGIGCFWSTPGTPTERHEGGAVEEVLELHESGRQVMVYFCTRPVPQTGDRDKLEKLLSFKSRLKSTGLYAEFESETELRNKVTADVSRLMHSLLIRGSAPAIAVRNTGMQAEDRATGHLSIATDLMGRLVARIHTSILVAKQKTGLNADELIRDLEDLHHCLRMEVSTIARKTDPIRDALRDLPSLLAESGEVLELTKRYRGGRIATEDHWKKVDHLHARIAALSHHLERALEQNASR